LDTSVSFSIFDKAKIVEIDRLYPDDFAIESKIDELSCQLDTFVAKTGMTAGSQI
jgi:hypothetical protein